MEKEDGRRCGIWAVVRQTRRLIRVGAKNRVPSGGKEMAVGVCAAHVARMIVLSVMSD